MRDEKVKRLERLGLRKDQTEITVYTDSSSDLPLLKYADKGIVVGKSQKPSWANRFEFLTWD
jgi:phosphoserine phosphatase